MWLTSNFSYFVGFNLPTCAGEGGVISEYRKEMCWRGRVHVGKEIKVKVPLGVRISSDG